MEEVSATVAKVWVLPIPTSEGTSKVAGAEPVVIILQELLPTMLEPFVPPPLENVP